MVVQRGSSSDVGASFPAMQPMERPAEDTLHDSGKGHRPKCRQMLPCADFGAVFHGDRRPSGDAHPGSHRGREVTALAGGLGQAGGGRAGGVKEGGERAGGQRTGGA